MEVRLLTGMDKEQSIRLRNYIFRSPYTVQKAKDYESLFEMADGCGAFDEKGNLLGQVLNLPLSYNFYGESVETVGVNHVGVLPESRGQGVAAKLMKKSIEQAYKRGQMLSMLMPFSVDFYRKFGFDLFTQRLYYEIPMGNCSSVLSDKGGEIERFLGAELTPNIWNQIKKMYEEIELTFNGTFLRTEKWWERHHYQFPEINYALIKIENQYVGYVSYLINQTTLTIVDMIYPNAIVEEKIWHFLAAHRANIFTIEGQTTPSKNIGYRFQDPRIDLRIYQNTMIRIIDVEHFLMKWYEKFPSKQVFDFFVKDQYGPWNEGRYFVKNSIVTKVNMECMDDQYVTIQELAAIFLGPLNSDQLNYQFPPNKLPLMKPLIESAERKIMAHFLGDF